MPEVWRGDGSYQGGCVMPLIVQVRIGGKWYSVEGAEWSELGSYKEHPPAINEYYDAWRVVVKATKEVVTERTV